MKEEIYIGDDGIKEYTYLGETAFGRWCVLKSILSPTDIADNYKSLKPQYFTHESTDWGGSDDLERVLKLENLILDGRSIDISDNPLSFSGEDYDSGHTYGWGVTIVRIHRCHLDREKAMACETMQHIKNIKQKIWSIRNCVLDDLEAVKNEIKELEERIDEIDGEE